MATTTNSVLQVQGDANRVLHLDLTAGGADTSVTFTIPANTVIYGLSSHNVTSDAINPASSTYASTTGVITVPCAASNRVRIAVFLA